MTKRKSPTGAPGPVSGHELSLWAARPNVRIRAGRACLAVAQALGMMQRQAQEDRAKWQRELRDVQEQTAQQIADWVEAEPQPAPEVRRLAQSIREGAWLPEEPGESETLTPTADLQPAVITEVHDPHPQQEPSGRTITPEPRPLVVL